MSEYIKREDAYKAFRRVLDEDFPYISEETPRERITAIPSADVVEVRHGQWVEVKSWESEKHSVTDMRCNLCGKFASLVLPHKTKCTYNYCPNCGARMDGEEE